ncbi:MAG: hypothetical protein HZC26_04330 [Candidatus Magasanikbacteria bacterium]|nr:hypothetical protein [Candidatus Magasanikbacteria bacterium]
MFEHRSKLTTRQIIFLSIIITLVLGLGFVISTLLKVQTTKLRIAHQDVQTLTSQLKQTLVATTTFKQKESGQDFSFPLIKHLAGSKYLAIIEGTGGQGGISDIGPLRVFSLDSDSGKSALVDSFVQSTKVYDFNAYIKQGMYITEFGFYSPGRIFDFYSLVDGQHLFSLDYDYVEIGIKRNGKELKIFASYQCPVYDETRPEQVTATGTMFGLIVNGKEQRFPRPETFTCELLDYGEGPSGVYIISDNAFLYNLETDSISFKMSGVDYIFRVQLKDKEFGKIQFVQSN